LSKDESAKAATNYLEDEIRQRVARGAVRFTVVLQLAAPGDKIDDPSVAWASTNKITTLGTLTVASVVPDSEATERALMFLRRSCLPASNPRTRRFSSATRRIRYLTSAVISLNQLERPRWSNELPIDHVRDRVRGRLRTYCWEPSFDEAPNAAKTF
jgi:hypothetical protein